MIRIIRFKEFSSRSLSIEFKILNFVISFYIDQQDRVPLSCGFDIYDIRE